MVDLGVLDYFSIFWFV